jgi:hypothetical protein
MTTFKFDEIESDEVCSLVRDRLVGVRSMRKDAIVMCEFEINGVVDGVVSARRKLKDFFCEKLGFDNILYVRDEEKGVVVGVFPSTVEGRLSATSLFSCGKLRNLKEGISEISGNSTIVVGTRRLSLSPMDELDSIVRMCFEVNELRDYCKDLSGRVEGLEDRVGYLSWMINWLIVGIRSFAPELYASMEETLEKLPLGSEIEWR